MLKLNHLLVSFNFSRQSLTQTLNTLSYQDWLHFVVFLLRNTWKYKERCRMKKTFRNEKIVFVFEQKLHLPSFEVVRNLEKIFFLVLSLAFSWKSMHKIELVRSLERSLGLKDQAPV